jgi:hypothetical protein
MQPLLAAHVLTFQRWRDLDLDHLAADPSSQVTGHVQTGAA